MKWALLVAGVLAGLGALVALVGSLLPRDHVASRSVRLHSDREAVWQVITDHAHAPNWRPELKAVERAPDEGGQAVWRELDRRGDILTLATVEETPPARLVRRIADPRLPFGGAWTYELAADGDGCRLTITERGEVKNVIFRFMARFVFGHTATIDSYLKPLGRKFGEPVSPA